MENHAPARRKNLEKATPRHQIRKNRVIRRKKSPSAAPIPQPAPPHTQSPIKMTLIPHPHEICGLDIHGQVRPAAYKSNADKNVRAPLGDPGCEEWTPSAQDPEVPEWWIAEHFPGGYDPDPAGDGTPNSLKYELGNSWGQATILDR